MDGQHTAAQIRQHMALRHPNIEAREVSMQAARVFRVMRECTAFNYVPRPHGFPIPMTDAQPFCKFDAFNQH